MVKPELLQKFKRDIKNDYDVDLDDIEAEKILENWTNFFEVLGQIYFQTQKN